MNRLDIVGFGPGSLDGMTIEAWKALTECDCIVGFRTYTNLLRPHFTGKEYIENGMGGEVERTREALSLAAGGKHVCLVCSGDSQVYGMAGLAYELAHEFEGVSIHTIPGVTAALSGSAILGSAAGNDLCLISLSDYHTSSHDIIRRLQAAAECDFVIALYNVRSKKRPTGLRDACDALLSVVDADRICGVAENIGRSGQVATVLTLSKLRDYDANMFTTAFIGNSKTIEIDGKMVTPRGYQYE